jgi:arylsulfatase A-like enzyme
LECTHNYNHSIYYADTPDTLLWKGYDAIAQAKDACNYIKDHANDKQPFFLFLSWGPPHNPYHTAPQKYKDLYVPEKIHLRPNVPKEMAKKVQFDLSGYYAHCTALDDMVGLLRNTLKKTGIEKKTIVIFISDHGDLLGSHGHYHKQQPYDESIRVPMIFYVPKALGGASRRLDAMINFVDFMPTLLGLTSIELPDCVEGIDYSKYIKGGKNPGDTVTLISCVQPFGEWNRRRGGREYRGLRSLRYTYVKDLNGPWLFFDNKKDPYQMDNLIGNKEYQNLVKRFDILFTKKLNENGDHFLPGIEYVKKWEYPPLDKNGTVPYYGGSY